MPFGSGNTYLCPYAAFMAADHPFVVAAVGVEKFWAALCSLLERPDLANDPRFVDNATRAAHRADVEAALAEIFRTRSRQDWLDRLAAADIPAAPILAVDEALATPQVTHRNMVRQMPLGDSGTAVIAASPIKFPAAGSDDYIAAPRLGEHTAAVLRDRLGYDAAAIDRLVAEGVAR